MTTQATFNALNEEIETLTKALLEAGKEIATRAGNCPNEAVDNGTGFAMFCNCGGEDGDCDPDDIEISAKCWVAYRTDGDMMGEKAQGGKDA